MDTNEARGHSKWRKSVNLDLSDEHKFNDKLCARLNSGEYKQIDKVYYENSDIHIPVINDITVMIIIVLILTLMVE